MSVAAGCCSSGCKHRLDRPVLVTGSVAEHLSKPAVLLFKQLPIADDRLGMEPCSHFLEVYSNLGQRLYVKGNVSTPQQPLSQRQRGVKAHVEYL